MRKPSAGEMRFPVFQNEVNLGLVEDGIHDVGLPQ
jgi:hypothetical protein